MDVCRTCLKTPTNKAISDLEKEINEDNKNYFEIMMFCLDIEVTEDSKISTYLCNICYRKIISFYKFKMLSLKNDAYLKSLNPVTSLEDQKLSVYVDGMKHEDPLEIDYFGSCIVEECRAEIEVEIDVKREVTLDNNDIKGEELQVFPIDARNEDILEDVESDKESLKSRVKEPKPEYKIYEEDGIRLSNIKEHSVHHLPVGQQKMLPCKDLDCPKLFYTERGQKYHYETKHLGMKYKCDICNKEVANLSAHKQQAHNPGLLPLNSRVTKHTIGKTFECDICEKKFRGKIFLKRHIRDIHNKERKFQCEFCSKGFFRKTACQDHVRKHTNERPFKCEECGKAFVRSTTLNNHRLIHVDEKKFQCDQCDKSFRNAGGLKAHMVTHTKEKPYPCGFCSMSFKRSDHRNRHEFTAHQKRRNASKD
ncbi:zinc finger protein 675-like [Cydia pomonella]|uniref:zinc finger protein 675-like n=1 Tax=Cydia pomonella TaxID=82600 RepID=UPI002ADDB3CA|nr:zinc finger protein 675-like [Cydia pomonella]